MWRYQKLIDFEPVILSGMNVSEVVVLESFIVNILRKAITGNKLLIPMIVIMAGN